ncbi:hypothetical protein M899_2172 [Bacteriovorax sp. BSW11_IV]|uniref:hypothetical protein n=1 Tax=Bacteriovorax sp. BSW11_IV TaxID=1353529 RepID=UPI000389E3BC|nr:hypothetical protein [Bacteriovorax sp. BSW11_IV]EQC47868.1 hypothetical protein M899_2172 [Bacteriovorax sp. BSW11_IV]
MKVESVEEFLKRGGKISKSRAKAISIDQLLFNEGVFDREDANKVKEAMNSILEKGLEDMAVADAEEKKN